MNTKKYNSQEHDSDYRDTGQAEIIVDDCKVTLRFSSNPDMTVISEIKQMMLSGLSKA